MTNFLTKEMSAVWRIGGTEDFTSIVLLECIILSSLNKLTEVFDVLSVFVVSGFEEQGLLLFLPC
jgi:hypothetical protein